MGTFSFTYSGRSTHRHPGVRAHVEQSRKRFQCDLFGFWRQCRLPRCRQGQRCFGDPHDCFSRHHAAMPRDHAAWLHAAILSRTTGTATAERALRAFGLSLPGHIRPDDAGLSPPQQTDDAVPTVDPARDDDDARRRAASWAGIASKSPSEIIAELEKALGISLTGKLQSEGAGPPPSRQADAEARAVVSERTSPASPRTGSEQTLPAADPSPPVEWRWTGPLNPPQATCDEQGRLIMPDRTEYIEQLRRGMSWTDANRT